MATFSAGGGAEAEGLSLLLEDADLSTMTLTMEFLLLACARNNEDEE